jgi:hypothetical protein
MGQENMDAPVPNEPNESPGGTDASSVGPESISPESTSLAEGVRPGYTPTDKDDCCDKVLGVLQTGVKVELTPSGGNFKDPDKIEQTWDAIEKTKLPFAKVQELVDSIIDPIPTIASAANPASPCKSLLLNSQAYTILKFAMEQIVKSQLGRADANTSIPAPNVVLPPSTVGGILPYYERVIKEVGNFFNTAGSIYNNAFFKTRLQGTRSELLWSYWHEEGMLVQTINAIALRFQNIGLGGRDPLANFELDSLRPISNILWGYVQDAQHRLNIVRRNYEYQSQYGIRLIGKAAPDLLPVTSRSNFIGAFHNLLHKCSLYFRDVDNLTIRADAFPLLNALREVNLLLTEGMHNQFNDLSVTARVEMMVEQWILGRKEIKEFLRGKAMVIYDEPWMGVVDTMKTLQGWQSTSIKPYHELAEFGEDILLSIRYTMWSQISNPQVAGSWANRFRAAIQRYIYSYQAVTGVDLTADNVPEAAKSVMPATLIYNRYQKEKMSKAGSW